MEYEEIDPKREFLKNEPLNETHWLDKEEEPVQPTKKTVTRKKATKSKREKSDNVGRVSSKKVRSGKK